MSNEIRKVFNISSADAYNKAVGLPTLHPLVTVIDLKEAANPIMPGYYNYGVYAIFLKKGARCAISYGRQSYDYQEGSIVTFAPGQMVEVEGEPQEHPDVMGLLFHPDITFGTPLAGQMERYTFFNYSQRESLHLSETERSIFLECLAKIRQELEHPVDSHSACLLSANIQLLLEYLNRFYDRQFITRHRVNSSIVENFEKELRRFFASGEMKNGIPQVSYFADKANLSPGYFGDLIKKETGSSVKDIISMRLVDAAKQRLASTDDDISIIAYDLGFQYPQHFTRLFKRVTGVSPSEFRAGA